MANGIIFGLLIILSIVANILCAKEYHVIDIAKVNWFQAQLICISLGYNGTSIASKEEDRNLRDYLEDNEYDGYVYWLGGNNLADKSTWTWQSSGKKLTYSRWAPGEPNNYRGNERCMALRADFKWNDLNCETQNFAICEKIVADASSSSGATEEN